MSRYFGIARLQRTLGAWVFGDGHQKRRAPTSQFTALETLEDRALLATINPSAVISSAPAGSNFNYTVTLTNPSSSDSGIGTFWYGWVPGQDFMPTNPISVTPPPGWTDTITHSGAGDGYAIMFTANSAASDVKAGSSMNFSFESSSAPAAINGNSPFYSGTAVGTSVVYPQAAFSDAGHMFVVTAASTSTPTPTPSPTPSPTPAPTPSPSPAPTSTAPVKVVSVKEVTNKKHTVTALIVDFSAPVNATEAAAVTTYRLVAANGKGLFTAKNSPVLALRSAVYNAANDSVTLTPRKAFAVTKAAQLTINASPPSGLQDSSGQLIDGNGDGTAGGNAVAVIRRSGATLNP